MGTESTEHGTYKAIGPFIPGIEHAASEQPRPTAPMVVTVDVAALCAELQQASSAHCAILDQLGMKLEGIAKLLALSLDRPAPVVNLPPMVPEIKVVPPPVTPQVNVEARPGQMDIRVTEQPARVPIWPTVALLVLVAAHLALVVWPMLRSGL